MLDLIRFMGWEEKIIPAVHTQGDLFLQLDPVEQRIVDLLKERGQMHVDVIKVTSGFPASRNAAALLELKMKGIIQSNPGSICREK